MKIDSSAISMESSHNLERKIQRTDSWGFEFKNILDSTRNKTQDNKKPEAIGGAASPPVEKSSNSSSTDKSTLETFQKLLMAIAERIYKQNNIDFPEVSKKGGKNKLKMLLKMSDNGREPDQVPQERRQMQLKITHVVNETFTEKEQMNFKATGVVKTKDGKTIDLKTELSLSREFTHQKSFKDEAVMALDPLIVNFDGKASELTDNKFEFDLNADGKCENISFAGNGSGFLALDLNNNNKIDDGSELFGPKTGTGFGELAKYDEDKNNWIDENDPVYEKLKVWSKNEKGEDSLIPLKDKNAPAISLDKINTEFTYKNKLNKILGFAKGAGVFLNDNGLSGLVQEVHLV